MPLEPLSALAVASSVITFVDFTGKLISAGIELYQNDILVEHTELKAAAEQVLRLRSRMVEQQDSPAMMQQDIQPQNSPVSFESLRQAQSHCIQCADEVIQAVRKLTVIGQHRKWQSFRHALSSVLGNNRLDTAAQRLADARQQFILFLLLHQDSVSCINSEKQLQATNSLEKSILGAVKGAHADLALEISQLRDKMQPGSQSEQGLSQFLHDPALQETLATAENVLDRDLSNMARTNFLATLRFTQISDRYDTIPEAHSSTFRWAVDHDSRADETWDNCARWMEASDTIHRIYWVTGQPGSGKSTLMKYLASSRTTLQLFRVWAGDRPVVLAQCYFWAPGTDLQKSLEGLLRTLVCQLLEYESTPTSIIENTCPLRWYQAYDSRRQPTQWTLPELKRVFRLTLEHLMQHTNVALFVDGLDEYGKDTTQRQELVDLFLALEKLPHLKMCLSSRPWNVFVDAFRRYPSLHLEELNRPDILAYVTAKCDNSAAFRELASINRERAKALKREIVDQSSGVFLWVTLVVKRLLLEMQDGPGLLSAEAILAEMPQGLDEYFKFMLGRIRPSDQTQASRIFQLMISDYATDVSTLLLLSFTDSNSSNFAEWTKSPSRKSAEIRVLSMKRFFKSQSMDLLVRMPRGHSKDVPWEEYPVTFLHRTVSDFLQTQKAQDLLQESTAGKFDTCRYSINALMSQFLLLRDLARSTDAQQVDLGTVCWFRRFVNILSSVTPEHSAVGYQCFSQVAKNALHAYFRHEDSRYPNAFLDYVTSAPVDDKQLLLAIVYSLPGYVKWYVNSRGRLLSRDYCHHYIEFVTSEALPSIARGVDPRMLAVILRHTERSPGRGYRHKTISKGLSFATKTNVTDFAVAFTADMRYMEFSSIMDRDDFSSYVEKILARLCAEGVTSLMDGLQYAGPYFTDAQRTWTVNPGPASLEPAISVPALPEPVILAPTLLAPAHSTPAHPAPARLERASPEPTVPAPARPAPAVPKLRRNFGRKLIDVFHSK